jgi:5-(carboxyamino)imidazole ribonucleotide synthase
LSGDSGPSLTGRPAIGIVGGGQLALMVAEAAEGLGVDLQVQTPDPADPAVSHASKVVQAELGSAAATRSLAVGCRAISFENEWVDLEALAPLAADGVVFRPSLNALEPLVSKQRQRALLQRLHLPCPRWWSLDQLMAPAIGVGQLSASKTPPVMGGADPEPAPSLVLPPGATFPLMAKAATGGYDGKGTVVINDSSALEALVAKVDPVEWILEEFVDFDLELSLVACRDQQGQLAWFPLARTHQHQQVCDWTLAPALVDQAVEALARNVAASVLTSLDYVGVLSIEFFYGRGGLLVNELAPRTHNSGHYTIEACVTSQFAQQVHIVAGEAVADTTLVAPGALMVNLLGLEQGAEQERQRREELAALPEAHLHWYGKRDSRPWRKLGHLTVLLRDTTPEAREREAERHLQRIRSIWPLPPTSGP